MSGVRMSEEQRSAAECLGDDVLLAAGAGCGKTATLVERYVNILRSGAADVRGVVAITFTEKAANELKSRVRDRLWGLMNEASGAEREFWRRHVLSMEASEIGTIHSFCGNILREFAVEAGVGASFSVLDELETGMLIERTVSESLYEAVSSGAAARLARAMELKQLEEALRTAVRRRETVATFVRSLDGAERNAGTLAKAIAERASAAARLMALDRLASPAILRAVSTLEELAGPDGDCIEDKRAGALTALREAKRAADNMGERLEEVVDAIGDMRKGSRTGDDVKAIRQALATLKEAAVKARDIVVPAEGEDWASRAEECLEFLRLTQDMCDAYDGAKRRLGALDFDDLLIRARDLLRDRPEAAAALASRIRHILVDEFQDTDHVQEEIVARLAEKGSHAFVVGDPEQSIYGFRGAEVEVFSKARERLSRTSGRLLHLTGNYRTLPHVVRFVNMLFGRAMPAANAMTEWRITHRPLVPNRSGNSLRVEMLCAASDEGIYQARRAEARALADRIREMVTSDTVQVWEKANGTETPRRPRYRDIAILLRSMSSVGIYERALQEADIPYYTVAGRTFYARQEVRDLGNLLRFAVDGNDTLSLVGALRSPLFAVSDDYLAILALQSDEGEGLAGYFAGRDAPAGDSEDAEAFGRAVRLVRWLRLMRSRLSAREAVDTIIEATAFPASLAMLPGGRQRAANVLALRSGAAEFDAAAMGTLEDFAKHLTELEAAQARESEAVIEGEAENVVRLMTIHAAKGLEFPIVVIADMGRSEPQKSGPVAIDRYLGVCTAASQQKCGYLTVLRRVAGDREDAEAKRVFYVAATRARDHLVLSGARAGGVEGWMAQTLDLLSIPPGTPGDHGFEGFTVEYSCPEAKKRKSGGRAGAILELREDILAGRPVGVAAPADTQALLSRIAPLPASAWAVDRLTATGIGDFCACPLKFEFAHLRGLPPAQVLEERDEARAPGHLVGSAVHAALEAMRRDETLEAALSRVIAADDAFAAGGEGLERSAREVLKAVERSEAFRRILAAGGEREASFAFLLDGVLIEGKMDRMTDRGVVDFKSDDVPAKEAREHAQRYRGQMDVYALAFARIKGRAPENVTLLYLRPGVEVAWPYGGALLGEAEDRLRKIIGEIRNGPPYRPRRRERCMCEYAALCEVICARRPSL